MNWMQKLEKKIGKYAIPNITFYFIILYVAGTLLCQSQKIGSVLTYYGTFSVPAILHGQVWRLITWLMIPSSSNFILTLIFMFCLASMGKSLEMFIGTFKMNVYMIGGVLLNILCGFLVYGITSIFGTGLTIYISPYYLLLSIFMALALCIPDAEVRLWFVLPIKMKWMLIVYFAELAYEIYSYFHIGISSFGQKIGIIYGVRLSAQILIALINLGLFFWFSKPRRSIKQIKRQHEFKAQFSEPRPGSGISKHKCAVCGRTELDDPNLTFRYCSKCVGAKEYCQDHLFTHTHVTGDFDNKNQNPYNYS